jgi:hypothetical protein
MYEIWYARENEQILLIAAVPSSAACWSLAWSFTKVLHNSEKINQVSSVSGPEEMGLVLLIWLTEIERDHCLNTYSTAFKSSQTVEVAYASVEKYTSCLNLKDVMGRVLSSGQPT